MQGEVEAEAGVDEVSGLGRVWFVARTVVGKRQKMDGRECKARRRLR